MQILLKGGRVVDPVSGRDESLDFHILDGRIAKMGKDFSVAAAQVIDITGKIIAPGFLDMHVHLREPGYEHKETILSGCTAAAAGGFTGVCCMPNTDPPIDDESVIRFIQNKARVALSGLVDVFPVAAVTQRREGTRIAPFAELVAAGAVGFSDDGDPVHNAEIMRRALEYSAMFDRPILQHAQDLPMTKGGVMNEGFVATTLGLMGMPAVAEEAVVARDIGITEFTSGRYHVQHVSTAGTVEMIRQAKARKARVSCEATPHHFTLTDEAVRSFDTNAKMNPPLRTKEDAEAIRQGLKDGAIDVIATDHAPHSFDEKEVEFQNAPFGIVGLETSIGLTLTELFHKNVLSLYEIVEKMAVNPRRIMRIPDIKIEEGESANLTIFDPVAEWTVDPRLFRSRSRNTPFGDFRLKGRPFGVLNNGQAFWLE
jgi:dihydroorotase